MKDMSIYIIAEGGKLNIAPGCYRGKLNGDSLEIIGATTSGGTLRQGVTPKLPVDPHSDVIVCVEETQFTVYHDISSVNIKNASLDGKSVPVTPEYLKGLAMARAAVAGPAIAQLNAILITNATELSTGTVIYIRCADFMDGVDAEYLDTVIATFTAKGFYILRAADDEISVRID
jgi:hypothetical protein